MLTIPDSNILVDVLQADPKWADWSRRHLMESKALGGVVINAIIYAEAAGRYVRADWLDRGLAHVGIDREDIPWAAAFAAGRAHVAYRKQGGDRVRVLPDFLIGAHASLQRYRVLTRDPARYRTYFPDVEIIAPDTHP